MRAAIASNSGTVLVVEDDPTLRFAIVGGLRRQGFHVVDAADCTTALAAFSPAVDAVVTDLRLPDGDAIELLPRLRQVDPSVAVIIVTGYGSIDVAVRAVKEGAEDFLTKPVDQSRLIDLIRSAVGRRHARRSTTRRKFDRAEFVSASDAMKRLEDEVERLRDADCSVLILGETGTGKSLLARRIHQLGARASGPFVDVNCAGLSREFVETELFGHERGAFTGAHAQKQGLLEAANGGTLFLDEIGDIDLQVQPKVLKVVEEKRFRRMGDVRERTVDVRLLAATHHDLLQAAERKTFRADLYYRISTVTLAVPPLRERAADVVPLAMHILAQLGAVADLATDAQEKLLTYHWPGNIRQLKNVLERALLLRRGAVIVADDIRFDSGSGHFAAPPSSSPSIPTSAPPSTLEQVEREHIRLALAAENGRVEAAARRLGIPRSTLYHKLKTYGITAPRTRAPASSRDPSDGGEESS